MDMLKVVLSALGSILILFLLTKLMGDKQMSQMSMFDYITGITIGSIAAEMATELEGSPFHPMIAMVIYGLTALAISVITCKSLKLRKAIVGKPILLYDNGVVFKKNLSKSRIDITDFLTQCRIAGYFNLSEIQTAIMEQNGRISFLPASTARPVNPKDMSLSPPQNYIVTNVILDGHVIKQSLASTGKNEVWLNEQLREQGYKSARDIFLATCDNNYNLAVYPIVKDAKKLENFE